MYKTFKIPKRSGGYRIIESPDDEIKKQQNLLLEKLYKNAKVSPFCHGGVPNRSIATNARMHVNKSIVGSIDIENFFTSIKKKEFDLQATHVPNDIREEIINLCFYKDHLPQGAPTSPYVANIFLYDYDWQCAWFCAQRGLEYSRYFDDITISSPDMQCSTKQIYVLLTQVIGCKMLNPYKLVINQKKTRIVTKKQNQKVCGVTVNEKLNVNRRYRNWLRSAMHHEKDFGFSDSTKGKISFVESIRNAKIPKKYTSNIVYLTEYLETRLVLAQISKNATHTSITEIEDKLSYLRNHIPIENF